MLDLSGELNETDGFIFTDIISGFKIVSGNIARVQGKLASMGMNMEDVRILMSIPGIDYYTSPGIYSEIGDISRFPDADHLASYTGLVPRVDQSGSTAIYGHITKGWLSVLRFFIVNAVHTLIRLSPTFKKLYRKMNKKLGKNRTIIAMARKLAVIIFNMLAKKQKFVENRLFKPLLERKLKSMETRPKTSYEFRKEDMEKVIGEVTMQTK
jgi:Transposase and inactivated derivatives